MEIIKEKFKQVIEHSQSIENINVDILFENWYKAKQQIIDAFHGQYVYEVEKISLPLSQGSKELFYEEFKDICAFTFKNRDLAQFLDSEVTVEEFFSNKADKDLQYNDIKIPKGMKIVKSFKFFESDKEVLNNIQSAASQIIQGDRLEGILCFSVHPLDFLSLSENASNWHSCHSLFGDYRAGNLAYMQDKSTIICYIKSEKNTQIPGFPFEWNNKKWRTLFHLSNAKQMIMLNRQYPFDLQEEILEQFRQKFIDIIQLNRWDYTGWKKDNIFDTVGSISLMERHIAIGGRIYTLDEVIEKPSTPLFYNDLEWNGSFMPKVSFYRNVDIGGPWMFKDKIEMGKDVKCLKCNKENITATKYMTCANCTDEPVARAYCANCESEIYTKKYKMVKVDENIYEPICDICARDWCFVCSKCHNLTFDIAEKFTGVCMFCNPEEED